VGLSIHILDQLKLIRMQRIMKFIRVSPLVFPSMNIIFFRSFRQKYLQSGGHDPRIIAGYSDLEYKLRSYGDYPWSKNSPEPLRQARCLYFYIFCFFTFCVYV
jgi:hypothetical protein